MLNVEWYQNMSLHAWEQESRLMSSLFLNRENMPQTTLRTILNHYCFYFGDLGVGDLSNVAQGD